jgi:N utilization substance protein B
MSAARARDIRRLAFQALFQLDARAESDRDELRATLEEIAGESAPELSARDVERALQLALDAYQGRREADRAITDLAPAWPAPRQPAVDRAILRLAYHEMTVAGTSPKVVVNEAVEMAKRFSTERSPAFVNGVLDKILKGLPASVAAPAGDEPGAPDEETEPL